MTEPFATKTTGRMRILFVSDEPNFARTVARVLDRCGYDLEVADCGEAALERIATGDYSVVLSESRLPGSLCGIALLEALRQRGVRTPVVLLAENRTPRLRRALDSHGPATSVLKDANLDQLKSVLRSIAPGPGLQTRSPS